MYFVLKSLQAHSQGGVIFVSKSIQEVEEYQFGEFLDRKLKNDLKNFIQFCFAYLHPATEFIDGWHIRLLCDYLEAVRAGYIRRLIINMPPRTLKSISVSVAYCAWLLGQNPANKIISASYSRNLSEKHFMDSEKILSSNWFQNIFRNFAFGGKKTASHFTTSMHGGRLATSGKSSIIGHGADYIIIDDPHNPATINSAKERLAVINWFKSSLITRLNNPKKGAVILLMQRVHGDDLCANLPGDWHRLSIPMIARQGGIYKIGGSAYHYNKGEALVHTARQIESEVGRAIFETQYMQNPRGHDTAIIKKNDFMYCDSLPARFDYTVQSWDGAVKSGADSAYSAGTCWGILGRDYYLIAIVRKKLSYPRLKQQVESWRVQYRPRIILIEDKASGQQLLQDLKYNGYSGLIACLPKGSKLARFQEVAPIIESGRVHLPGRCNWLDEYLRELCSFPAGASDDLVDSTSQFLKFMQKKSAPLESQRSFIRSL